MANSWGDFTLRSDTPNTGTGSVLAGLAAAGSLKRCMEVMRVCSTPSKLPGCRLAGHLAVRDANGRIDICFTDMHADTIARQRVKIATDGAMATGRDWHEVYKEKCSVHDKPLREIVKFKEDASAKMPSGVADRYNNALGLLHPDDWPLMESLFETRGNMCVPTAFLHELMCPESTMLVGQLGFSDSGECTDWECGSDGIGWC